MQEYLNKFDKWLEGVMKDLPKLPDGGKKFLVEVMPWLALLGGIMGVMGFLGALSLGGMAWGMAAAFGYHMGVWYWLNLIVLAVLIVLDFKAYKPLKEKKLAGWRLIWYANVFGLAEVLVSLNVVGVIGMAVGFYLLYQIKESYK